MNRAKQSRSRVLAIMVLVMLFLGLASVTAGAAEFSLGAGVAASTSPYKSHDSQLTVSSFISYDNGRVYLRGAEAGVYLWNTGRHKVSAAVQYSWLEFDPGACDDGQMRGLEKRRSTLMAGLSYTYAAPLGQIRLGVTGDVLGRSGGFVGEAAYQHNPITLGNLTLLPGLGVSWQCREHADYYFGVSRDEAARSGLERHEATDSFLPFAGIQAQYAITDRLSAVVALRGELLTGSVKDSPMAGRSYTASGAAGLQFTF